MGPPATTSLADRRMESGVGCAWKLFSQNRNLKRALTQGLWRPGLGEAKRRLMQGHKAGWWKMALEAFPTLRNSSGYPV